MTDTIAARRPRTASSGLLLKTAVVIPDLIIASLLWLVIIALVPPVAGFGLIVGGLVFGAVLAAGLGEDFTVRVLYRSRRATPAEAPRLAVVWRIATHRSDADGVRLRIVNHGPPVGTAGRQHVLLRSDVVAAYCTNQITAHQVADLITQGIGRLCHGHTRFDLLWTFWTIPWDLVRGLAHAIGRRLIWIPLVQFAWRIRLVVGTIAVILEAHAGRWPSPIVIAGFIALSHLMPLWHGSWESGLGRPAGQANVLRLYGHEERRTYETGRSWDVLGRHQPPPTTTVLAAGPLAGRWRGQLSECACAVNPME